MYLDGVFDMFDTIKNLFSSKKKTESTLTAKEIATAKKEPYIVVVETKVDPDNPANGYFELDWNSYFVDDLRKAGYNGITEEEIVDKWFKALCQNILIEDNNNREVRIV